MGTNPAPIPMRHGRSQNETAALDADDDVDALLVVGRGEHIDGHAEALAVPQQGRDVVEEDAGLRKVRNVSDVLFEIHELSAAELCRY
jgi:hypothetical protein